MKEKSIVSSRPLHWVYATFFALYAIVPTHFAIGISEKLPLLTLSRLLLVAVWITVFLQNREKFLPKNIRKGSLNLLLTQDKPLCICMVVYFVLLIIVNCTFLFDTSEAIKQLFVLVAEEYLLAWMLTMVLDSREKIVSGIKILMVASAVCGVIAASSVIANYNLFNLINLSGRKLYLDAVRYGMLRPAAGFSHPVYYSAFCAVMLPLGMYLIETVQSSKERRFYAICTAWTLAGLLLANSRGSQLAFLCVAGVVGLARLVRKDFLRLMKTYVPIILVAVMIFALVFLTCPAGRIRVSNFLDSISISQPVDPDPGETTIPGESNPDDTTPDETVPDETVPEDSIDLGFGENKAGVQSRLVQLTGITYTFGIDPVFGLGPNAFAHGLVGYKYVPTRWSFVKSVDVNIVAIICQYGIVGFLGYLSLFGSLGISFLRKKYREDKLMQYLLLSFVCYMLCLFSISSLDKWFWVFTGITLALVNIIQKEAEVSK